MPLPIHHPDNEQEFSSYTSSLGATPVAVDVHAGRTGMLTEIGVTQNAAVTGTSTVTVTLASTGAAIGTLSVTGGAAGTTFTANPNIMTYVVEDDAIIFTPAGGTGAASGVCFAKIRG